LNIPGHANALDQACPVLNIHRGHYARSPVGAILATVMAAGYPGRMDRLALVGCPVWEAPAAPQRLQGISEGYDENGLPGLGHIPWIEDP
jgi:pimeloyl-ACP methyl ester carboxylesterase